MIEYSKQTLREMFDGRRVSPILPYMSLDADRETMELVVKGNGRISLSGVQPKYSMVVDDGSLRLSREGEQGLYILKPAPTALFILDKEYCPANAVSHYHNNTEMKEIGQKIRDRRVELGINQQTLADLAEVGINTVVAIERGTGNPSINTLQKIVNVLGMEICVI